MTEGLYRALAELILYVHFGVVLFNIFWLVAIPLGAWFGWMFVRIFWWRALHLFVLFIVALQAAVGRDCFLTLWHDDLMRRAGGDPRDIGPIESWINWAIYWPLPLWAFSAIYVAVVVIALALWRLVPPNRRSRNR